MNEREIIEIFRRTADAGQGDIVRGIGDDCAVLKLDGERLALVTMDTLFESIHFDTGWHPPEKLGRKAVAVNVSDIAAMGGTPRYVFLSLALPGDFSPSWLDRFSMGIAAACREYGCILAGGDTVRSTGGIVITLTVLGEAEAGSILYRNGARPGDGIWISGFPGQAAAGLDLFRSGRSEDDESLRILCESHLDPQPRLDLARRLAASGLVHAMMDLSDGMATDLAHLCTQSGVGAIVYAKLLPVSEPVKRAAGILDKDYLPWVVSGGEDYELLFTASMKNADDIGLLAAMGVPVTQIGHIVEGTSVRLIRERPGQHGLTEEEIAFTGYDHFRKQA